jgi:hypothetical protein
MSAPSKPIRLADRFGAVLGGRIVGEEIRREALGQVARGEKVVLDLDGVEAVSPSFADEIFGKLHAEAGDSVEIVNVGEALQRMAKIARAGREDPNGGLVSK